MKVTVCFGPVRVVVPCGDGDLLIKDLTRQAIHRYKKAVGKCASSDVVVHSLHSVDGGILDPDDRLSDVADDREQLVATFVPHPHQPGDGASNSSRGTPSPDHIIYHQVEGDGKTAAIEVRECDLLDQPAHISSLQVRRGSEPALNHLQDNAPNGRAGNSNSNAKRWSAAPVITESTKLNNLHKDDDRCGLTNGHNTDKWRDMDEELEEEEDEEEEEEEELMNGGGGRAGRGGSRRRNGWLRGGGGGGAPFARDGSNRLSMQFLGESPTGLRWADAADRASKAGNSLSLPREASHRDARIRKEPLGQANSAPTSDQQPPSERWELICLSTESGALGIHVVPDVVGGGGGLVVQAVEEGGRVDRDGRLKRGDRITQINGRSLIDQPFHVVQDIFRESLRSSELRLRVVKPGGGERERIEGGGRERIDGRGGERMEGGGGGRERIDGRGGERMEGGGGGRERIDGRGGERMEGGRERTDGRGGGEAGGKKQPPPPVYPKPPPPNGRMGGGSGREGGNKENQIGENGTVKEKLSMKGMKENNGIQQVRKQPVVGMVGALQTGNTRRIGRKIEVQLVKGVHGLGFSITTRDNPAGGNCPIYIKNILPKGAAVEDGRLRPGDRLLAVDGCQLTGKTQAEAVALLRQVPANATCLITVSRHDPNEKDTTNTNSSSMEVGQNPSKHQQRPVEVKSNKSANHSNQDSNSSGGSVHSKRVNDSKNSSSHSSNQDDSTNDSHSNLWKQKEIVTLYIPVHDTEKAGLGVSVKGKTSGGGGNSSPTTDLGIFIKNVLHGGAASRDGRLRTNDQLLSVNGITLSGLSNQAAMETLRRAMLRTEGPVEGSIVLTVARRIQGAGSKDTPRRGSVSSLLTDSSANTETFGSSNGNNGGVDVQNNSGNSEASDSTVICLPTSTQHSSNSNSTQRSNNDGVVMRNAVLERLTGQTSLPPGMGGLHNESYYRATHQTTLLSLGSNPETGGKLTSPTVNQPARETLIIEDDSSFLPSGDTSLGAIRPLAAMKPSRTDSTSTSSQADATYASQLSLDSGMQVGAGAGASATGFSRDAFGRQSMSEKRHATLDAKNTDTYRRTKRARELRQAEGEDMDRSQLGPSLGMKKSSSLESLQTMVQEMQMYEDIDRVYPPALVPPVGGVIRGGRGCNESFRAAVDRSYEAPVGGPDLGGVGGHLNRRQTSLDSKLKAKKRQSLLRGLGSMFRFGKHRKAGDDGEEENEEGRGGTEGEGGIGGGGVEEVEYDEHQQQVIQEQLRRLMVAAASTQPSREAGVDIGGSGRGGNPSMMTSSSSLQHPSSDVTRGNAMMTSSGGQLPQPSSEYAGSATASSEHTGSRTLGSEFMGSRTSGSELSGSRTYGNELTGSRTSSNDMGGSRTTGSDIVGSRTYGNELTGSRTYGNELTGSRTSGNEMSGSRTLGNELTGSRTTGSDMGGSRTSGNDVTGSNDVTRTERIQQLRAHHQLRHQERRGHYPLDDTEERYEMALRQRLEQQQDSAINRPGSRVAITDPARFSHYVNYQQIQHHLNRRQQHYHSQRREATSSRSGGGMGDHPGNSAHPVPCPTSTSTRASSRTF
ncbi:partitioning defective 3 homolog isoform X2 [Nilaparvata lugens]|uniref:partitioning defective 3 homolog isoform X2 n=1 Tax=Nilaparvata lugens TaxID=108931 RepID=UPI00193EA46E|nr:partitioning defective 3 homolog isoform X2 [Nilaparvata lugens]